MRRAIAFTLLSLALVLPAEVRAEPGSAEGSTTLKVERVESRNSGESTLQFLKDNRNFLRTRLDFLRMIAERTTNATALDLDPRFLNYQSMLDAIRTAQDSASAGRDWIERAGLLESVEELAELEREMDSMERLLEEQGIRLSQLEEDFAGRQETSLIVLIRGVPRAGSPSTIVLSEEGAAKRRIALDAGAQRALTNGGAAELFYELVEPRPHSFEISFEGANWGGHTYEVAVEPERDRLTFLELDLATVDPNVEGSLGARTWVR